MNNLSFDGNLNKLIHNVLTSSL